MKTTDSKAKPKTAPGVGSSVWFDNANLKKQVLANLALGRGFSDQEREVVEKSSAKQLRAALPYLLGLKRRQAPILRYLEDSACECPAEHSRSWGRKFVTECRIRIVAFLRRAVASNAKLTDDEERANDARIGTLG